jgi:NAD(P)-dependent dehydrogenase (short-subunit alcohol dehydrogenase family)
MRKPVALVSSANGEIGNALVHRLVGEGRELVTVDVAGLDEPWQAGAGREREVDGHAVR